MLIEYVPLKARGEDAKMEGKVELTPTSFDQRWEYVEQCGFKVNAEGEVEATTENLGSIRKMVSLSKPHYKSVALKDKESGMEYKSFEDLSMDPSCDEILIEIAGVVLRGQRPTKN